MACKSGQDGTRKAHFTFVWAIENASTLTLSSTLRSPEFVVQTMDMIKWHLEAHFDCNAEEFALFICREPDGCSERFEIDFMFSLIGVDEYPFAQSSGTSQFQKLGNHRCEVIFSGDAFCELLPKETLTVRCQMWKTGCDVLQSDLCFARTYLGVEQLTFVWALKRFSSLRPGQNRTLFLHPTFEILPTLILTFCLQENDGKEYGYIAVQKNEPKETRSIVVAICLLSDEGWSVKSTKKYIEAAITPENENVCEFKEFFDTKEILTNNGKFLVNDVLSLKCEFEISAGPLWSRIENYRQLESSDVEAFASEMSEMHFDSTANACCPFKKILKTLYEDGTLSDISLKAGSQSFAVHKNILVARSPVFKAMFTKDMREKTAKCIDIPDLNAETLRLLLLYIYTNRVEKLQWESASDLFGAADKYELLGLREICSDFLKVHITASNACDILILADMHHDEDLRKAVQDFMSQESDIFNSDGWKKLKEKYSKLAIETAEQIILQYVEFKTRMLC